MVHTSLGPFSPVSFLLVRSSFFFVASDFSALWTATENRQRTSNLQTAYRQLRPSLPWFNLLLFFPFTRPHLPCLLSHRRTPSSSLFRASFCCFVCYSVLFCFCCTEQSAFQLGKLLFGLLLPSSCFLLFSLTSPSVLPRFWSTFHSQNFLFPSTELSLTLNVKPVLFLFLFFSPLSSAISLCFSLSENSLFLFPS